MSRKKGLTGVVTYIVGLYWMYLIAFSDGEAIILSGLYRYLGIPLYFLRVIGPWLFVAVCAYFVKQWRLFCFLRQSMVQTTLLICIGFLTVAFESKQVYQTFNLKIGKMLENNIAAEGRILTVLLKKEGIETPVTYIIAQGSDRREYYYGLYNSIGDSKQNYKLLNTFTSWGEKSTNHWMGRETVSSLQKKFSSAQVLWVVKSDPWMNHVLDKLVFKKCIGSYDKYFLIRTMHSNIKFECFPKAVSY